MFKLSSGRVLFTKDQKIMVKEILIKKCYEKINTPPGLKKELTRIWWRSAKISTEGDLLIEISVAFTGQISVPYLRWNNDYEYFYKSEKIYLKIPINLLVSENRDLKLVDLFKK